MDCDSMSEDETGSESLSTEEEEGAQLADNEEEDEMEYDECEESVDDDDTEAVARQEAMDHHRADLIEEVAHLEHEFLQIKNSLFAERLQQVERKLAEVREGRAVEYLSQLTIREENCRIRKQVAQVRRDLELESAKNVFLSCQQGSEQDFLEDTRLAENDIREEVQSKIAALEADRTSCDIRADLLWQDTLTSRDRQQRDVVSVSRPHRRAGFVDAGSTRRTALVESVRSVDKRRKPVTVAGPYIIYMLQEEDIIDDLTVIKAALKSSGNSLHSPRGDWSSGHNHHASSTAVTGSSNVSVRCDDRRLFFNGDTFHMGNRVLLDFPGALQRDPATLVTVHSDAVVFKTSTGRHRRVTVSNLRRGRVSLSPCP